MSKIYSDYKRNYANEKIFNHKYATHLKKSPECPPRTIQYEKCLCDNSVMFNKVTELFLLLIITLFFLLIKKERKK